MAATLLFRAKHVFSDGTVIEMVMWRLPRPTRYQVHGLKYRLHFGTLDGATLVRYDNERPKGDHRHTVDGREESYVFVDVETLMADFLADVARVRGGAR